jgi:glycosyltransferase involved in cell wall biosynthesis
VKVLSLNYEYPPIGGGGGVAAAALNAALVEGGDTVRVVTSRMHGLSPSEIVNGVAVTRSAAWRRHRHFTTAPELATTLLPAYLAAAKLIREERPDVLHTHFALPSGVIARQLSSWYGIPYVLTAHGSDIPGYNPDRFAVMHRLLRPFWKRIVLQAAAVTSPSEFLAGLIRKHANVPIHIVPNGYNPAPSTGRPKRKLVLVVARLFRRKGVQHFIRSVDNLDTDWEFVVAGDGPYYDELRAQARNTRANIQFTGFIDKTTLQGLYEEARILVFPSIRENFPMVLLEAMEAGCAVITTDAEGCAEVVGDSGLVIPKGAAAPIRTALCDLMQNPAMCDELARKARRRVELFRWPRIAGLYRDVFQQALTARTKAVPVPARRQPADRHLPADRPLS